MEIQLLHVNDAYKETDIMKALDKRNGKNNALAILSVLVEEQKSKNSKLDSLLSAAGNVTAWNDTKTFDGVRSGVILS